MSASTSRALASPVLLAERQKWTTPARLPAPLPCACQQSASGVALAPEVRGHQVGVVVADGHLESVLNQLGGRRRRRDVVRVEELERHHRVQKREQRDSGQVVRPGRDGHRLTMRRVRPCWPTTRAEVDGAFDPRPIVSASAVCLKVSAGTFSWGAEDSFLPNWSVIGWS